MNKLLKLIGILALLTGSIFTRLFMLDKIYRLTAQPLFNGPTLTMFQMFALSWFACVLTYKYSSEATEDRTDKERLKSILVPQLALLLSWGLAYLIFRKGL